jgi:hypothetical protein
MASSGKKKTTMAKLTRESKLRERRQDKQARKEARKLQAANPSEEPEDLVDTTTGEPIPSSPEEPALEAVGRALTDA